MTDCDPIDLTSVDGARLSLRAHGAHVTGWTPAGGTERLWLSRTTGCGPGVAIRGGVPVIWPQFSGRGPLPRHGVVRDRAWVVERAGVAPDGAAEAVLRLASDEATQTLWPALFWLELTVRAMGDELRFVLRAHNTGDQAFAVTAALHAYFRVTDLPLVTVDGVGGHSAEDNAAGGAVTVLPPGPLSVVGPLDIAVRDVLGGVRLTDPGLPNLIVETEGLPDLVVWNPGPGVAPGDVHAGGEAEFVCVEPALLTPFQLAPGDMWQVTARVRVSETMSL